MYKYPCKDEFHSVAVMQTMESMTTQHRGAKVHMFNEDHQFTGAVQPACAVVSGSLSYRLPRVQDENDPYSDLREHNNSIRWYSRVGTQEEQAEAVTAVVIPDLLKNNITDVTILLALEEQILSRLDWTDTFPLLVKTLKKVLMVN